MSGGIVCRLAPVSGHEVTVTRSRYGRGTLRHVVHHETAGLYSQPTPPAFCGAAPGGGWVATRGADCPRCLDRGRRMDEAEKRREGDCHQPA